MKKHTFATTAATSLGLILLAGCSSSGSRTLDTSNLRMAPTDLAQTYLLTQPEVVDLVGPVTSVAETGSGDMQSSSPFGLWSRESKMRHFTVYGPKGEAFVLVNLSSRNSGPWRVDNATVYTRDAYRLRGIALPPHPEQDAIMQSITTSIRGNAEVLKQVGTVTAIDAIEPRFGMPEVEKVSSDKASAKALEINVVTEPLGESPTVEEARAKMAKEFAGLRFYNLRVRGVSGTAYASAAARKKGDKWIAQEPFLTSTESAAGAGENDRFPEDQAFSVFRGTAP